jgi:hypothetical protein
MSFVRGSLILSAPYFILEKRQLLNESLKVIICKKQPNQGLLCLHFNHTIRVLILQFSLFVLWLWSDGDKFEFPKFGGGVVEPENRLTCLEKEKRICETFPSSQIHPFNPFVNSTMATIPLSANEGCELQVARSRIYFLAYRGTTRISWKIVPPIAAMNVTTRASAVPAVTPIFI